MSIISVKEHSVRGSVDRDGHRTYSVRYLVRTDNRSDGALQVMTDILSPAYASSYSFGSGLEADAGAYRQSASCEPVAEDDSLKLWNLTIQYSSRPVTRPDTSLFGGGTAGTTDPTTLTKITGSFVPYADPVTRDKDGTPVTNAAGDPFLGLTADRNRPTLNIEKTYSQSNFASLLPTLVDDVSAGKLNNGSFFYKGAGYWKLSSAPWAEVYHGETKYYVVTFAFESNSDKWQLKPANRGPRYKSGTQFLRFADDKGLDYGGDGLGPLDADGTKRDSTADPKILYYDGEGGSGSAGEAFDVYVQKDFSAAPYSLPTTL